MKRYFLAALLLIVVALPTQSHAFGFERGTAVRLNDHTLLYFISFGLGHNKYDFKVPVTAVRGSSESSVGYDVLTGGGLRTNIGNTSAIVLSNAQVKDGMYLVPKRSKATFTLVTVLNVPKGYTASSTAFNVQINSLPFELGTNGLFNKNGFTASELSPFKTLSVNTNLRLN